MAKKKKVPVKTSAKKKAPISAIKKTAKKADVKKAVRKKDSAKPAKKASKKVTVKKVAVKKTATKAPVKKKLVSPAHGKVSKAPKSENLSAKDKRDKKKGTEPERLPQPKEVTGKGKVKGKLPLSAEPSGNKKVSSGKSGARSRQEDRGEKSEPAVEELTLIASEEVPPEEEVVITDAEGRRYCRVRDCDQIAVVDVYCRYHYLAMWKRIQQRRMILSEGKLEKYIEELTSRYGDKYLEIIRKDLRTAKDFLAAIQELEIDENLAEGEFEEDEARNFIEEMRGVNDNKQEDDY